MKKRKNNQRFRKEYSEKWPYLIPGKEGYARCSVCNTEFSITHGGKDDCRRHVSGPKHSDLVKAQLQQQSISNFYPSKLEENGVIKAETLFVRFLIEHNIPLAASDHSGVLFTRMFPDSDIAKKFSCGHTKTHAIAAVTAETYREKLVNKLRSGLFSLSTDGSNDISDKKLYPLVINFFDDEKGQVVTSLLSLSESSNNTGEGIFNFIDAEFQKFQLKWENCIAFGADNTNTMAGCNKGVLGLFKKKQPNLKFIGCPCHLIHLAAQKATNSLAVDVEGILIKLFYYLEKSSKRKSEFKNCQVLSDVKIHKIFKHVSTRWLSLENALTRLMEQWVPLQIFFANSNVMKDNENYLMLCESLKSPKVKLYCVFVMAILPTFTKVNVALQKEQPCIHTLHDDLMNLYYELLVRFIKPATVTKSKSLLNINFQKAKNQKSDDSLVVGSSARVLLQDSNWTLEEKEEFFLSVRKFFVTACKYIIRKFPLQDEFFKHASVANIFKRQTADLQSVKYFTSLFNCCVDSDQLELELAFFQADSLSSEILEAERVDVALHKISQIKNSNGYAKYVALPKVMMSILSVPHSNAASERIFSMVRKNQTESRSSMNTKTLESLLITKLNMGICYDVNLSSDDLKKAKGACYLMQKKL
ncbi:hypothetical protein AVEN_250723-1 [Araneus ventricosus]|uniref:HAT C-terminal dimerisation domain-containing protein n=1 Tax=Araneus ventricosus TaxID=182803 RepID=A0A4Y2LCL8_ARAVE|nr:hypothetical protein AVEN_250723-1 [Araneus ventricosus]